MNFDFYEQYREYPNVELLKIIAQPGNYQPQAVEAASRILQERNVTVEETEEAAQYFGEAQAKEEKMMAYKEKAKDFLQPVIQPEATIQPGKWLNIFLLLLAIYYLWTFAGAVRELKSVLRYKEYAFDLLMAVLLALRFFFIPVVFYLLLKRKRWGWILLFADSGISVALRISESFIFFKYTSVYGGSITSYVIVTLIRIAFMVFLWRKEVSDYFGIIQKTKRHALLFVAIAVALVISYSLLRLIG